MHIYTTQLAEPAFAIPAVIEHRDRLGGGPDFVQCKMKRAGKARACTVMQTRARTTKISKRAGREWATTDWTGPDEKQSRPTPDVQWRVDPSCTAVWTSCIYGANRHTDRRSIMLQGTRLGYRPDSGNYLAQSSCTAQSAVFKSVFDSQKRRGARPAQAELVKVQAQGNSQLGARRRLNMVKKGAEERMKTFLFRNRWLFGPRNLQSALNEMFFLPLFIVSFFFCRTFTCWGKHQSPALREQHQFRTRSVGQAWSWSACTVRKKGLYILAKQCVSSERCAMPKACSVCHHGNKVEQTQQTKLSLQDVGLVVFLNLARRSLFLVKHDKRTDKATNHNDCTNNF